MASNRSGSPLVSSTASCGTFTQSRSQHVAAHAFHDQVGNEQIVAVDLAAAQPVGGIGERLHLEPGLLQDAPGHAAHLFLIFDQQGVQSGPTARGSTVGRGIGSAVDRR